MKELLAAITALLIALKEPLISLGRWLNPDRRREARKDKAIDAAVELIAILRKEGGYSAFPDAKLKQYEKHYQKQFDAWRNG